MAAAALWPVRALAGRHRPGRDRDRARQRPRPTASRRASPASPPPGFRAPRLARAGRFELIFANILAGPLKRLAPQLAAHQAPGGVAILSGLLARQAAGVRAVYAGWGYRRIDQVRIDDWMTLVLRRP